MAVVLPDEMPPRWLDQVRVLIQDLMGVSAAETRRHFEETRRHFDVVAEGLRSDVRAIAEGHALLNDKLDRFQLEVRREFRRVDRRLLRLEARR
jgi:phytoene/squalene synthetase